MGWPSSWIVTMWPSLALELLFLCCPSQGVVPQGSSLLGGGRLCSSSLLILPWLLFPFIACLIHATFKWSLAASFLLSRPGLTQVFLPVSAYFCYFQNRVLILVVFKSFRKESYRFFSSGEGSELLNTKRKVPVSGLSGTARLLVKTLTVKGSYF